MRDRRMDRFVILPFSVGCVSQSSVAVCGNQPKRGAQTEPAAATPSGDGERQSNGKLKNSFTIPPLPRPNISAGFHKLVKSLKSLSQYFVLYREEDEEEVEMEIGFPTDVQHVAHIGWDGLNNMSSKKSWDKAAAAPEFLSLPSFSLKQFELAMAAQAGGAPPPSHGPHGSWPQ